MRNGPILIIDDDEDDQFLVKRMLTELNVSNPIRFFANGPQVLDYLTHTNEQPFIVLCDINMPLMGGLELRQVIDADPTLHDKAIPFVFMTTDASRDLIKDAYRTTTQGFFRKAVGYEAARAQLNMVITYWQHCLHPSDTNRNE